MKTITFVISFLLIISFPCSGNAGEKVAVLNFKSILAPPELGEAAAEILRTELASIGDYTIVERGMLENVMKEQSLQLTGAVDPDTAVNIGKLVGAQVVIIGSVVKTGKIYTINSRFIEVETGIVKIGKNIRGEGEDQISDMLHQLALNIQDSFKKAEPFVYSFENKSEALTHWMSNYDEKPTLFEQSTQYATTESHSLKVTLPKLDFPGMHSLQFPADWSAYTWFKADVYFPADTDKIETLTVRIDDKQGKNYDDRFHWSMILEQGANKVKISIAKIKTVIDIKKIRAVYFFLLETEQDVTLYFDNIRLE